MTDVFRECGGARCSHNMVPYPQCRQQALNIVQQLMLSTGGDDDMGTLLGLMHTAKITALELKTHILKVCWGPLVEDVWCVIMLKVMFIINNQYLHYKGPITDLVVHVKV